MSGDVVARAKAALDATRCADEMQEFFRVGLVRELIEELEMQTSLQGLSVQIPEYGEWGSETLLCLFQDFGIQPGDGYQEASSRQGDLLRALAAANAEVEKLQKNQCSALCSDIERDRDRYEAEVEKLRGAIEAIRTLARVNADRTEGDIFSRDTKNHNSWVSVLAVIERAGIEP